MSDIAIRVENLCKRFRAGPVIGQHRLSEALSHMGRAALAAPGRLVGRRRGSAPATTVDSDPTPARQDEFWALKDVSFEVKQGEVVGIIGRNGAGKSTLLKILSRITEPTSGRFGVRGRVGSLLEVGAGFHPELTGRENIYLSGTLLGMARAEIKRRFDEIVAFAEVDRFLDTPVKRYSSGMYVRLGFAVAAHLQPEILIVDEVLAVGDAQFQKKCLGKMGDVAAEGRTVLFVSHNMAAVRRLCHSAAIMNNGRLDAVGAAAECVAKFLRASDSAGSISNRSWNLSEAPGSKYVKLVSITVYPDLGETIEIESGLKIDWSFHSQRVGVNLGTTVEIRNQEDVIVLHDGVLLTHNDDSTPGQYDITASVPPRLLNSGTYSVSIIVGEYQTYPLLRLDEVVRFEVRPSPARKAAPGVLGARLQFTSRLPTGDRTGSASKLHAHEAR